VTNTAAWSATEVESSAATTAPTAGSSGSTARVIEGCTAAAGTTWGRYRGSAGRVSPASPLHPFVRTARSPGACVLAVPFSLGAPVHLSTLLDCDLVAVEQTDELTLLVELTAPTPATTAKRQPATLQVVLDRSGSMGGDRLEGAKTALLGLVDRLDPSDNLGIVAFDDAVQIVVPAGPLTNKAAVKAAIAAIDAGGCTDLSAGYLRGLPEAQRVAGPTGATVLLISDGHANAGVTDADQLGSVAAQAKAKGVTTSTLGFGLGYDERLLAALARGGAGNELFAEEADSAVAKISGEVDGLLDQVAQAASLRLTWSQ
jgi:Ca-activated chloride channel family protein